MNMSKRQTYTGAKVRLPVGISSWVVPVEVCPSSLHIPVHHCIEALLRPIRPGVQPLRNGQRQDKDVADKILEAI
jgi:hypothetical protein